MKISNSNLITPVYLKTDPDMPWPENESVFHLLTGDGLYICREHPFFRSSSPVSRWPAELAGHDSFIDLKYPRIPRRMFEQIVGFFALVGLRHGAEAAVLLAWNRETESMELIVPDQEAMVGTDWYGRPFPINVWYDVPPIPDELILIGDVHCHVDGAAYASHTDVEDEAERPGLHIVVGRIQDEPPDLHIEVTVDGNRFKVSNHDAVIEGYKKRRPEEVPDEWLERVTVIPWKKYSESGNASSSSTTEKVEHPH